MKNSTEIIKNSLLNLSEKDLQEFSDICSAVEYEISGDGGGLTSGFLIDKVICEFFSKKIKDYEEYHIGESDFKLSDQPLSFKKIKGASAIALSWSKNPAQKLNGEQSVKRSFWEFPVLILNLQTDKWWSKGPQQNIDSRINWTMVMHKGFYIIDNKDARSWIKLEKNNKSDSIVSKDQVYKMLFLAQEKNLFISIPESKETKTWSLLYGVENKKIDDAQTKNAKTETRKFIPITDVFDKELFEKGIPVLAEVNAGEPLNIAEENLLGYIVDGENKKIKKDDLFAVRVDGNSMNKKEINGKKITNGSYALVKNTQDAENGDIILAIVNGNATIKQYYKKQNTITLRSISTQNTPDITITNPDPPDFLINGQIVGVV